MAQTDRQIAISKGLSDNEFRRKYKCASKPKSKSKHMGKWKKKNLYIRLTKRQIQQWWANLSNAEKAAFVEKKVAEKTQRRHLNMLRKMKKEKLIFDCYKCIHGLTGSCTDRPENGCTYFYNTKTNEHGPAYAA